MIPALAVSPIDVQPIDAGRKDDPSVPASEAFAAMMGALMPAVSRDEGSTDRHPGDDASPSVDPTVPPLVPLAPPALAAAIAPALSLLRSLPVPADGAVAVSKTLPTTPFDRTLARNPSEVGPSADRPVPDRGVPFDPVPLERAGTSGLDDDTAGEVPPPVAGPTSTSAKVQTASDTAQAAVDFRWSGATTIVGRSPAEPSDAVAWSDDGRVSIADASSAMGLALPMAVASPRDIVGDTAERSATVVSRSIPLLANAPLAAPSDPPLLIVPPTTGADAPPRLGAPSRADGTPSDRARLHAAPEALLSRVHVPTDRTDEATPTPAPMAGQATSRPDAGPADHAGRSPHVVQNVPPPRRQAGSEPGTQSTSVDTIGLGTEIASAPPPPVDPTPRTVAAPSADRVRTQVDAAPVDPPAGLARTAKADVAGVRARDAAAEPVAPRRTARRAEAEASIAVPDGHRPAAPADATVATDAGARLAAAGADRQLGLARSIAWADGIARDIAAASEPDGTARFTVTPEALGTVRVEVRRDGDVADIAIVAANADARDVIADARPDLVAAGHAHGIAIRHAEVTVGTATDAQPSAPNPPAATADAPATISLPARGYAGGAGSADGGSPGRQQHRPEAGAPRAALRSAAIAPSSGRDEDLYA